MTDISNAAINELVGEAMGALDNAMSVRDNERYRVKLLQLAPAMIDTITALRAERDKAIELCGKAQDRWNEGIDERERLQSALIDMTAERDAAYAAALNDAAAFVAGHIYTIGGGEPSLAPVRTNFAGLDQHHALIATAILALQPKTVEQALAGMVHPLVWRESICPANAVCHAVAPCGTFFIDRVRDGFIVYHDNNLLGRYTTLEAAESAAQTDYVRRCIAPFIKCV